MTRSCGAGKHTPTRRRECARIEYHEDVDSEALEHNTMAERKRKAGTASRARRKRDPESTREAILEAAREVLAEDGKEGLSVARVAQRAGVNRGTAYQHFQTREQLIETTAAWVSEKLYSEVFGDPTIARDQPVESISVEALTHHLAEFAMENPGLGRVWLFELLSSRRPASDPFWQQYESNFEMLAGCFLWPVWARAHTRSAKERRQMAERFAREIIRMSLHGTLRPEKYPELDAGLPKGKTGTKAKA
jgi:AcrR family transcriptional regulator